VEFEVLALLPEAFPEAAARGWAGTTPLALPSITPTASLTPSTSPSPAPAIPGVIEWVSVPPAGLGTTFDGVVAGAERAVGSLGFGFARSATPTLAPESPIYVCRGRVPGTAQLVPGKMCVGRGRRERG
jgi:hypothetical protein